jgi:hypothetical protein
MQKPIHMLPLFVVGLLAVAGTGHATPIVFTATLSGGAESPANSSPGTGFATVTFDTAAHTLRVEATFSGLLGNSTNSHIHAATSSPGSGTAGVATMTPSFTGFPSGVTAGSYDHTFSTSVASSFNASYVTANGGTVAGAEAALFAAMDAGKAYLNIHSSQFAGGEIRGFLQRVPEPATGLAALAGLGLIARRRR